MTFFNLFNFKVHRTLAGFAVFTFISCGSFQQVSYYDNDGIYGSGGSSRVAIYEEPVTQRPVNPDQNNYYQNYFGDRAQELDQVLEQEIFTDIDSYSSLDSLEINREELIANPNDYLTYEQEYESYPAWGDRGGNVTVNVYGNNMGMGWNNPWFFNGWGYNSWYRPWRSYAWNGWGWGYGGFYDPWFGSPWGGFGYYPFYNNFYANPYHYWGYSNFGYRNYAYGYSRGRRGYFNNNQNRQGSRYAQSNNTSAYRLNSGRSNATSSARVSSVRSSQSRLNTDAAVRNETYRNLRTSRSSSPYSGTNQYYRSYSNSGTRLQSSPSRSNQVQGNSNYRSSGTTNLRSTSSYRSNNTTGRTSNSSYRSSGSSRNSSSGNYRSSGSSNYRSSGSNYNSGSSRSSGSSSSRGSSSGGSRSSGGRTGGGRGN